jgi:hypothetical protein
MLHKDTDAENSFIIAELILNFHLKQNFLFVLNFGT